jgi:hypothetical protein
MTKDTEQDTDGVDEAIDFLKLWPGDVANLCAIMPDGGTPIGLTVDKNDPIQMDELAEQLRRGIKAGRGLYFYGNGLSVRLGNACQKADEKEVKTLYCFHVDADVPKSITDEADFQKAKADLCERVRTDAQPPSVIIDSGNGFRLFWLLSDPVEVTDANREQFRSINRALAAKFDGDNCHNLDRVMRLPGTINYPGKTKRARGRTVVPTKLVEFVDFIRYRVEDFEVAADDAAAATISPTTELDIPDSVDFSRLDPDLRKLIVEGPGERTFGDGSRSDYAYYVACQMRRYYNMSDGEIVAVITNPDNKASEHVLDQKQRTPIAQATRLIEDMNRKGVRFADGDFDGIDSPPTPEQLADDERIRETNELKARIRLSVPPGSLARVMDKVQDRLGRQVALKDPVFKRHGKLVRLSRNLSDDGPQLKNYERDALVIVDVNEHWFATRLEKSFEFVAPVGGRPEKQKKTKKGEESEAAEPKKPEMKPIHCPMILPRRILNDATNWQKYPTLHSTIETPTLRSDGTILDRPGYDLKTGLFFDPGDVKFPAIEKDPTREQGKAAMKLVDDVLVDFPFEDNVSKAVAISMLLTAAVRRTLDIAPVYGIDADDQEAGKTTLGKVAGAIATGRDIEVQAFAPGEEERAKLLAALLATAAPVMLFDNIEDEITSPEIEKAITSGLYASRPFGKNDTVRNFPTNSLMIFTGNKIQVGGTFASRMLKVRLVPQKELAERAFKHPDLIDHVIRTRPTLVAAILTALRCYLVHGVGEVKLKGNDRFPEWSKLIRAATVWYGYDDPLKGGDKLRADDPVKEAQREVLRKWWLKILDAPVTAKQLIDDGMMQPVLADALRIRAADLSSFRVSPYIERMIGVRLGLPVSVVKEPKRVGTTQKYRLALADGASPDWVQENELAQDDSNDFD